MKVKIIEREHYVPAGQFGSGIICPLCDDVIADENALTIELNGGTCEAHPECVQKYEKS
jgi:hypothetical protein